jgi:hypothetical protein
VKKEPSWEVVDLQQCHSNWPLEVAIFVPEWKLSKPSARMILTARETVQSWYMLSMGIHFPLPLINSHSSSGPIVRLAASVLVERKPLDIDFYEKLTQPESERLSELKLPQRVFFLDLGFTNDNEPPQYYPKDFKVNDFVLTLKAVRENK